MNSTQQHSVINGVYHGPEKWSGELNLSVYAHEITSLGNLREVSGYLNVAGCTNLVSLGELTFVGGTINLNGCEKLANLGKLHTVGVSNVNSASTTSRGSLDLEGCHNLKSLSNLTNVGWTINIYPCKNLIDIGKLHYVGGMFTLSSLSSTNLRGMVTLYPSSTPNLPPIIEGISPVDRVDDIRDRIAYYQSLPLQEALNALHTDEVQCTPLYHNILTNMLQGDNTLS